VNVFNKKQNMARYRSDQNQIDKNGPGTLIEFMPDPNKNIND
jgi:hypothetical protein